MKNHTMFMEKHVDYILMLNLIIGKFNSHSIKFDYFPDYNYGYMNKIVNRFQQLIKWLRQTVIINDRYAYDDNSDSRLLYSGIVFEYLRLFRRIYKLWSKISTVKTQSLSFLSIIIYVL